MKKSFASTLMPAVWSLLLLAAIGFSSCKTTKPSGGGKTKSDIPAEVAAAFREDAARLAVRDINSTKTGTGELEGAIPKEMIDKYYKNLCDIYLLAKKIDTIPDLGQIHTQRRPDLQHITVVLNADAPFRENWSKGFTLTDDLYMNQLIGRYKLSIDNYREGSLGPTVRLKSPDFINTTEVAFLLSHMNGIRSAEAESTAGDGNNIEAGAEGKNAFAIRFSQGKGDCPSGCIYRKYWVFYVNPDNSVQFIGTRGFLPADED